MNTKNLVLLLTFISFLMMASVGALMYFSFQDFSYHQVLGLNKNTWLNIHMMAAAITSIFIFYHVALRWDWIENIIFRKSKSKPSRAIIRKRRINSLMMFIFSLSFLTGFLNFLLEGECLICEEYHGLIGLIFIFIFILHMINHSFPSKKYFK